MSMRLYPTESPIQQAINMGLAKDLKRDYGASGSAQTTTGSMTAGSNVLTLAAPIDFVDNQAIAVVHAGPGPYQVGTTTALAAPTGLTVTNYLNGSTSTTGTTTRKYWVAACDDKGGITAAVSVTTVTSQATLSQASANFDQISWTESTNAWGYVIWGDASNPDAGSQGLLGTQGHGSNGGTRYFLNIGEGGSYIMGTGVSDLFPPAYTTAPLGQTLLTSILSGSGSTSITVANAASATASGHGIYHDDTAPVANAVNAGLPFGDAAGGTFYVDTTQTVFNNLSMLNITGTKGLTTFKALPGSSGGNVLNFVTPQFCQFSGFVVDGNKLNNVLGTNEEYQNGLRLVGGLLCSVDDIEGRNTWMSPIKLGGGSGGAGGGVNEAGCTRCFVSNPDVHDGYDQGIGVWSSSQCVVDNPHVNNSGWSGISLTESDKCVVNGGHSNNNKYLVNYYNAEGHGIAIEGGYGNIVHGLMCDSNNAWAAYISMAPFDTTAFLSLAYTGTDTSPAYSSSATNLTITAVSGGSTTTLLNATLTNQLTLSQLAAQITALGNFTVSYPSENEDAPTSGIFNSNSGAISTSTASLTGIIGATRSVSNTLDSCHFIGSLNTQPGAAVGSADGTSLNGCKFLGNSGDGFQVTAQSSRTIAEGIESSRNGNNGVVIQTGEATINGLQCYNNAANGVNIGSYGNGRNVNLSSVDIRGSLANNLIATNSFGLKMANISSINAAQQGILIMSCTNVEATNILVQGCGISFEDGAFNLRGVSDSVISNLQCVDNHGSAVNLEDNGSVYCLHNRFVNLVAVDNQTTPTQTYAFQETGSSDYNLIDGGYFNGNTQVPAVTFVGAHSSISGVDGYNPVGALTAPTVGASPWTYTNSNNVPVTLYVSGGTVTSIVQSGVTTGLVAGAFPLEVGQSVVVTYTAAPTVALIGA